MYLNFICSGSEKLSLKSDQLELSGSVFLRINMLELIVSLFLMKNDGLGMFFSQNDIYITKLSIENA